MERYEREKSLSIYWINRANDLRGAAGAVWFAIQNESKSDQIHNLLGMELAIDSPSLVLLDAVRALVGSGIYPGISSTLPTIPKSRSAMPRPATSAGAEDGHSLKPNSSHQIRKTWIVTNRIKDWVYFE
jgi:hypothetical protein